MGKRRPFQDVDGNSSVASRRCSPASLLSSDGDFDFLSRHKKNNKSPGSDQSTPLISNCTNKCNVVKARRKPKKHLSFRRVDGIGGTARRGQANRKKSKGLLYNRREAWKRGLATIKEESIAQRENEAATSAETKEQQEDSTLVRDVSVTSPSDDGDKSESSDMDIASDDEEDELMEDLDEVPLVFDTPTLVKTNIADHSPYDTPMASSNGEEQSGFAYDEPKHDPTDVVGSPMAVQSPTKATPSITEDRGEWEYREPARDSPASTQETPEKTLVETGQRRIFVGTVGDRLSGASSAHKSNLETHKDGPAESSRRSEGNTTKADQDVGDLRIQPHKLQHDTNRRTSRLPAAMVQFRSHPADNAAASKVSALSTKRSHREATQADFVEPSDIPKIAPDALGSDKRTASGSPVTEIDLENIRNSPPDNAEVLEQMLGKPSNNALVGLTVEFESSNGSSDDNSEVTLGDDEVGTGPSTKPSIKQDAKTSPAKLLPNLKSNADTTERAHAITELSSGPREHPTAVTHTSGVQSLQVATVVGQTRAPYLRATKVKRKTSQAPLKPAIPHKVVRRKRSDAEGRRDSVPQPDMGSMRMGTTELRSEIVQTQSSKPAISKEGNDERLRNALREQRSDLPEGELLCAPAPVVEEKVPKTSVDHPQHEIGFGQASLRHSMVGNKRRSQGQLRPASGKISGGKKSMSPSPIPWTADVAGQYSSAPVFRFADGKRYVHPLLPFGWKLGLTFSRKKLFYSHPDFGLTFCPPVHLPSETCGVSSGQGVSETSQLGNRHQGERSMRQGLYAEHTPLIDQSADSHLLTQAHETRPASATLEVSQGPILARLAAAHQEDAGNSAAVNQLPSLGHGQEDVIRAKDPHSGLIVATPIEQAEMMPNWTPRLSESASSEEQFESFGVTKFSAAERSNEGGVVENINQEGSPLEPDMPGDGSDQNTQTPSLDNSADPTIPTTTENDAVGTTPVEDIDVDFPQTDDDSPSPSEDLANRSGKGAWARGAEATPESIDFVTTEDFSDADLPCETIEFKDIGAGTPTPHLTRFKISTRMEPVETAVEHWDDGISALGDDGASRGASSDDKFVRGANRSNGSSMYSQTSSVSYRVDYPRHDHPRCTLQNIMSLPRPKKKRGRKASMKRKRKRQSLS